MATWISGTNESMRSRSEGSSQSRNNGSSSATHLQLTRHQSHSGATGSGWCFSCPELGDVRRDTPPQQLSTNEEFHRTLIATKSLCENPIHQTLPNQALVETYSRYSHSSSSRPSSGTDRCSPRGSISTNNAYSNRKLSSVSSCRSSSEIDCVSFDEELDLSKVIPEIRIDISARGSPTIPYKDHNIVEILDFLFLGDIEAANREPLLCRLNINYLVDLSNLSPHQMRRRVKLKDCPCLCPSERKHSPIRLTVLIDEAYTEDIEHYFDEINAFIEGARKTGHRVLIFCVNGQTVSPTLIIQYMMKTLNWTFNQALAFVKSRRTDVQTPKGYMKALVKLERHLLLPQSIPSAAGTVISADSPDDQTRYGRRPLAWT